MSGGRNRSLPSTPPQKIISIGTAGTGVTASNYVSDKDITTVLSFTDLVVGQSAQNANKAIGVLVYTFPAGTHLHLVTYMDISLKFNDALPLNTDTGVGSVVGAGAVNVLGGTATFEDYITGQTIEAAALGGTAVKKATVATAGALTGISVNEAGSVKAVYLNVAAAWPNVSARDVSATGSVTLKWCKLS